MTKEQFHQWCCANLQFARTDQRFMEYVNYAVVAQQPITTAQDALWVKLITKHQRQLRRQFSDDEIRQYRAAPWATPTVETYRFSQVSTIERDGTVYIAFKTPFKKDLNQALQTSLSAYRIRFSKTLGWYFEYSPSALRDLLAFLRRREIQFRECPVTQRILAQTRVAGSGRAWAPMVHPVGERWMVSNLTESLLAALPAAHDHSLEAVVRYSELGVAISPCIRRQLRARYGLLPAEIAAHHRVTINKTALPNANAEVCRYILLARPRAVIVLTTPLSELQWTVPTVNSSTAEPVYYDGLAAVAETVGARLVFWRFQDLGTNSMPAEEAELLLEHNAVVVTDFSSWLDRVQAITPAKIVAVIQTQQKKLLWKQ